MITHEDYKLAVNGYIGLVEVSVKQEKSLKHMTNIAIMLNYGKQQETLEAKHEALVKDVARFIELVRHIPKQTFKEYDEWCDLNEKLSKVGKEE